MLRVSYVKDVPCTLYETLSPYYDSEHIATVAGVRSATISPWRRQGTPWTAG
jgi:hypothetical protein